MRPEKKSLELIKVHVEESSEAPITLSNEEVVVLASSSTSVKATTGTGVVHNCYALHVRNGGTHKHKVIGYLAKGDKVTITGVWNATGWFRIKWKGGVGYVNENYIKATLKKTTSTTTPPKDNTSLTGTLPYLVQEISTLEGDASVIPNFKLKPRDIVEFKGLGSKLSGRYYIKDIKIKISENGIEQTLTVTKNAFG